jgi:hypothetical protein
MVIATAFCAIAGCSHKRKDVMKTELELQHDIDLGVILDTTMPLQLSIPVKNVSDRKLRILRLSKDCSCTSVSIDRQTLMPGETGYIRVVTNLTGKSGQYVGEVAIESDSVEKIDEIQIHGRITGQIRIRPARTAIQIGDVDVPAKITVYCDDQDGKWNYTGFESEDKNVSLNLKQMANSPTTSTYEGVMTLNVKPEAKNADYRTSMITLKFVNNHLRKTLEMKYPVDIVVRKRLTFDPSQVLFAHGALEQKRTILVQGEDAARVDSAQCSAPFVRATIRPMDQKTVFLEIAFDPSLAHEDVSRNLTCDLLSSGKTVASIPVSIVDIP